MAKYTFTSGQSIDIPDEGVLYKDSTGQNVYVRKGGTLNAIRSNLLSGVDVAKLPTYQHTGEQSKALAELGGTGGGTQVTDTSIFGNLKAVTGEEITRSASPKNPQGADIKSNIKGQIVTTPTIEENLTKIDPAAGTPATLGAAKILSDAQKGGAPVSAEAAKAAGIGASPAEDVLNLPQEGRILTDAEIAAIRKQQGLSTPKPTVAVDPQVERAKAMVAQTKAEGSKPFSGSSYDTQGVQAEIASIDESLNAEADKEASRIADETTPGVRQSSKLLEKLAEVFNGDAEPVAPSLAQTFQDNRAKLGVGELETKLASVDSELAKLESDYASVLEKEEGRTVSMAQIGRRQSALGLEYNRQKRDLEVKRSSLAKELDVKYGVINTITTLTGQDYDNATQAYERNFTKAVTMFNVLKGIEDSEKLDIERKQDNARANVQIMANLLKEGNTNYASLPESTKLDIRKAELAAGFPAGFVSTVTAATGKTEIQFLPSYTDVSGNRVQPVATKDEKGAYTISNVTLGKEQSADVKADVKAKKTEEDNQKKKEDDFAKARKFIADNPNAKEPEIQVALLERTDLTDGDIAALLKEKTSSTPATPANVKSKMVSVLAPLKSSFSRSEAKTQAESQLKKALGTEGALPKAYLEAIDAAITEVYGATTLQKAAVGVYKALYK